MKITSGFLSSIRFAFWTILLLIAWLGAGALLATDHSRKAFLVLNDTLVLDWLFTEAIREPLLLIWFGILCVLAILLVISFVFCTFPTLLRVIRGQYRNLTTTLLLGIHLLCILIAVFHALSFITGFKEGHIRTRTGDTIALPDGFSLCVKEVIFVDDPALLTPGKEDSKIRYTRGNFSDDINRVGVMLLHHGMFDGEGSAFYMKPYVRGRIRITLESFTLSDEAGLRQPEVYLTITRNPLLEAFFISYCLLAVSLILYTFMTWKQPLKRRFSEKTGSEDNNLNSFNHKPDPH